MLLEVSGITKTYGPQKALDGVSLSVPRGQVVGLLGPNGAGKSTLVKALSTGSTVLSGDRVFSKDTKIGYFAQHQVDELYLDETPLQHLARERPQWAPTQLRARLAQGGIGPEQAETLVGSLSGGQKARLSMLLATLDAPHLVILDEPTNHLDAESVAWLERFLEGFPGTVVAITHDRYFLDNAAGWILELDRGYGIPYEGNYSDWLDAKEQRLGQEQRQEASHQKAIKAELEWVRSNPKGRQAKSKARLSRFDELQSQEFQSRNETNEIYIPPGPRLGDNVIEVKNLKKGFGDRLLFDDVSFVVPPGSIVGIIGANGMGKSTLFKIMIGEEQPDGGEVKVGETVKLGYVDQSRDDLAGDKTVWEELSDGNDIIRIGNYEVQSRSYCGRFNFKGSDQQKFVKDLSGGERNRLHLAKLLKQGANVLLLDEPTNDLDVETLRALEEAILAFPGAAMVISHDRWFLDRIATHILAYEDDGGVVFHEGNFSDYEEDRKKRLGAAADQPHRIKYRKLK